MELVLFIYMTALAVTRNAFSKSLIIFFSCSAELLCLHLYVFDEWMMLSLDILRHPGHIKLTQLLSSGGTQEELLEKDSTASAS